MAIQHKPNNCNCVILVQNKTTRVEKTSQIVRFLASLVACAALLGGICLLCSGIAVFFSGWYAVIHNQDHQESFENIGIESEGEVNENEETGETDNVDEGTVRTFIVMCTIASIVTEIVTAVILCSVLVGFYIRMIRSSFKLKKENMLLNSTAFFLIGFTIYLTALAFSNLHEYVLMANEVPNDETPPYSSTFSSHEFDQAQLGQEESDEVSVSEESEESSYIYDSAENVSLDYGKQDGTSSEIQ